MKKVSKNSSAASDLNSNAIQQKSMKKSVKKAPSSPLPAKKTPVLQKKRKGSVLKSDKNALLNESDPDDVDEDVLDHKLSMLNNASPVLQKKKKISLLKSYKRALSESDPDDVNEDVLDHKLSELNNLVRQHQQQEQQEQQQDMQQQSSSNADWLNTDLHNLNANPYISNLHPKTSQLQGNVLDELVQKTAKIPAYNETDKRTPTNETLLRLQKPGLLMRQAEFMNGSMEERRKNYIKGAFIELKNIPLWSELGPRLMDEGQKVGKSKMAKKSKSSIFRSSSVPPKDITPEYEFNPKLNEKISIYKGDIATLEVDAVVITTGASLQKNSMSSSVFEGAGEELMEEVKLYRQNQIININPMKECQAFVFAAYRLPAPYTIHVVYPRKDKGKNHQLCYKNVLNSAVQFNLKSVAIPCMGTGGNGYPSAKGCKEALDAVRKWLESPEGNKIDRVIFCCYKDEDFQEYKSSTFLYFPIKDIPKDEVLNMAAYFGPGVSNFDVAKLKELSQRISYSCKGLDFSDCGDCVTDFAFWILNHYCSGGYQKVKSIDCTGCNRLTDSAMFAISGSFPRLEELQLIVTGCTLVTEYSLAAIRWAGHPKCAIQCLGCHVPQLQPYLKHNAEDKKKASPCTTYKVIFLRTFGMQHKTPSMISQLVGKVGRDSNVSQEWKGMLRYEQKVTNDGSTLNLYEIEASLLEFVGTERSIIVLPSLVTDSGSSFKKLLSTAIAQGKGAPIISMSPGASQIVKSWTEKVEGRIREEVIQKINLFQAHDSLIAANLLALRFWLKRCQIYETKAGNPLITNLNSKEWKTATQFVDDKAPYLDTLSTEKLSSVETTLKDKPLAELDFNMEREYFASILMGNLLRVPKSNHIFNMKGKGSEIMELFNQLFGQNKVGRKKLIPWLQNDGVAASLRSIEATTKHNFGIDTIECEHLLDSLERSGVFCAVVLPWMNDHVSRPALIPTGSFEKEPPIEPESIWQDHWNDDEQELCLLYSMPLHPNALFMDMLFQKIIKLSFPVLVWRYGIICHIGSHEIFLRLSNGSSDTDAFSLFVGIRGMNFRESSGKKKADNDPFQVWQKYNAANVLKQSIGEVFQLIRQIVDVCLIETGTYAMPQLRCPYCRVKDRIHYYDVQKITSNPNDPIKCHTFKEQIPYEELFIGNYFDAKCAHFTEAQATNALLDPTYRCSMCWARMTSEIDYTCGGKTARDSTCMQCHMCKNCIARIKNDHTTLLIKSGSGVKSRQTQAIQSEAQGFECSLCAYRLPSQDILVKHMIEWCPYRLRKLIQKDNEVEKPWNLGRIISVKNVPKTIQFCLNDNFCNSVDVLVLDKPNAIYFRAINDIVSFPIDQGTIVSIKFVRKYDRKAVQFSVNGKRQYEADANDNFARVCLMLSEAKASVMILPQNRNLIPMQYPLRKRMYLEVSFKEKGTASTQVDGKKRPKSKNEVISKDTALPQEDGTLHGSLTTLLATQNDKDQNTDKSKDKAYLAFIREFDSDGKIKLSFEDYDSNIEENQPKALKFHGFITDKKLHPLGWSSTNGYNLIIPDAERSEQSFDYIKFLDKKVSTSVPMEFFGEKQCSGTVDPLTTYFESSQTTAPMSLRVGMKLEAVDRKNPHLTCVATIQAILPGSGQPRVEIYFDGWSHNFDYTTELNHTDLHPLGYCDAHGITLQAPKEYGKMFDWATYLRETESDPVPYSLFTQEQIASTPLHPLYRRGIKSRVEAINDAQDKDIKAPKPELPHFIQFHKLMATKTDLRTFSSEMEFVGINEVITQAIPYLVPLPSNMDARTLLYPSRKLALDWSVGNQTFHGLCLHDEMDTLNEFNEDVDDALLSSLIHWDKSVIRGCSDYLHLSNKTMPLDQNHLLSLSQTAIREDLVQNGTRSANVPLYTTKYKPKLVESIHCLYEALAAALYDSMKVLMINKVSAQSRIVESTRIDQVQELEGIHRYLYLNLTNLYLLIHKTRFSVSSSSRFLLQVAQWMLGADKDMIGGVSVCATHCPLRPAEDQISTLREKYPDDGAYETTVAMENFGLTRRVLYSDANSNKLWDIETMKKVVQNLPNDIEYPNLLLVGIRVGRIFSRAGYMEMVYECIKKCPNLKFILIDCTWHNQLQFLNYESLEESLIGLSLKMRVQLTGLQSICKLKCLQNLRLRNCGIEKIPENIANLQELQHLNLSGNLYSKVPHHVNQLKSLRFLDISATPLYTKNDAPCTIDDVYELMKKENIPLVWGHDNQAYALEMIHDKAEEHGIKGLKGTPVEVEQIEDLNKLIISVAPRMRARVHYVEGVFGLSRLQELFMNNHCIVEIPKEVENLCNLVTFSLRHSKNLVNISQYLGTLKKLIKIDLEGCTSLQTPPPEVVRRGSESVMAYLKRLLSGFKECKRTKLMFVGLGGAGKTSLVRALLSGKYQSEGTTAAEITDGIDIVDWSVRVNVAGYVQEQTINYSIWDFAGQSVYYNTHQFFLSNRAVYFLLWNTRLGYEHAGLDFWLSSITCHAPKAPIFVVGTHVDQVHHADLPETELKQTFPQIVHFCLISALAGIGVEALAEKLFEITLQQKYMGERIPSIWLNLENDIISQRRSKNIIPTKDVEAKALTLGLLDMAEVREALTFLHELGSLQYFSNEFLRDQVVINPQWLVDVMACLVTVKESVIKDGRFNRDDIDIIWKKYDHQLHQWLLQLTEEFDLTYALPSDNINVVPCLLPEQEPLYEWPEITDDSMKEMKMTYRFEYLPAGLFNRTQTRLCQYADSSVVWKKGSMLRKNQHVALIRQSRDKELIIKVQGPRPENVLFLIHEVISTLVHQFFQGVSYDLSIPCSDCVKSGSQDPNMFSAKQIKRAADMKAPFLQCSKNFHIVALGALQEFVPPSSVNDFETHLTGVMHDLKQLKSNLGCSALFLCCPKDLKAKAGSENGTLNPNTLVEDLKKAKIKIQTFDGLSKGKKSSDAVNELAGLLNECSIAIACISDSFCKDKNSTDLFTFFKRGSHRPIIPVVISSGEDWKNTGVGMLVTTEMYVDMRNMDRYKQKLQELISRLNSNLNIASTLNTGGLKQKHDIFFSYCWANSHDAIKKGSKAVDGSLGEVDPRDIESYLTKNSQKVWLDLRCAKEGVLFEEIAEALRGAKLMIACVSDQYLASRNCMLEYRFASGILKIPLILCVVGTGSKWHISEITMLALSAPRVDFQTKSPSAYAQLLKYVDNILVEHRGNRPKTGPSNKKSDKKEAENNKNYSAYAELRELAQRKFLDEASILDLNLRQNDSGFSTPYPRLFFIDVNENININDYELLPQMMKLASYSKSRKRNTGLLSQFSSMPSSMESRPGSAMSLESEATADVPILCIDFARIKCSNMGFKLLCEWDGEWHTVGKPIPFPEGWNNDANLMILAAPYLAKIYSILQHSPVSVKMLEGKKSDKLLNDLKRIAEENDTDSGTILSAYKELVQIIKESNNEMKDADKDLHRGGLLRCSLHSRRILWLCPEHQKKARAIIPDDVIDTEDIIVNLDNEVPSFTTTSTGNRSSAQAFATSHKLDPVDEDEMQEGNTEPLNQEKASYSEQEVVDHDLEDVHNEAEMINTGLTTGTSSRSPSSLSRIRSKMCLIS